MYLTFIRPMFEYCCHLVPIKKSTLQEVLAMEKAFFNAATGIYRAPIPWFRKLFKLEDFPARRISLRDKMKTRVTSCSRINESVLVNALRNAENKAQSRWTETVWNEADQHKVRRLPIPDPGLHLSFYSKHHKHRVHSMKWFLHRFPARPYKVQEVMGAAGDIVLERLLRILPQHRWDAQDSRDLVSAINAILELLPTEMKY